MKQVKQAPATDALRQFYFSGASNYGAFNNKVNASTASTKSTKTANASKVDESTKTPDVTAIDQSATHPNASTQAAPVQEAPAAKPTVDEPAKKSSPAGSGLHAVKRQAKATTPAAGAGNNSTVVGHSADSVSPDYIEFLRQQQDLMKAHAHIDECLALMLSAEQERRHDQEESCAVVTEMLKTAEGSSNWNWKSKYTRDGLIADASLLVPDAVLYRPDDIPNVTELQYQGQQLLRLKQMYADKEEHKQYKLVLDNGIRRMERLVKEVSASQLDSTPIVRLSDNLLVQLDSLLSRPTLDEAVQEVNDTLAVLSKKQQHCAGVREQALDDGEMHVAERETYNLIDLYEELVHAQIDKINLLSRISEETTVANSMRKKYTDTCDSETKRLQGETNDLKKRCEEDLARLYQLQKTVDDAENQMKQKCSSDRQASDDKLQSIGNKQREAWEQIESLVKLLRDLEAERHAEVKKRLQDKINDESRCNEYAAFTEAANKQGSLLDQTIKNCDTKNHCLLLIHEYISAGLGAVNKDLNEKQADVDAALLKAHTEHLHLFQGLYFTLGELEHRKEKRVDEVGAQIQAAHIQQEMCNDSLNPNAKKFSDAKKNLLTLRDDLLQELEELRERGEVALAAYEKSDEALVAAAVPHKHPREEQAERKLNLRQKMVDYKAMSLGHVSSEPVVKELEDLKKSVQAARTSISKLSVSSVADHSTSPL